MQSLGWYVRRLGAMNPAEILWRLRSALRDQADIIRIPAGLIPRLPAPAVGSLRDYEPGFNCSPVSSEQWSESASDEMQAWSACLLSRADNILDNRLSYFDLDKVDHGTPFNWHRDHSAGINSPVRLSVLTDYRDFSTYGDCKLVWEPNRNHQFVVLARAFVASGDRRYANKLAELFRSWIDANPFGYGMNWKSALEHGIRIINWVWSLDLIRPSNVVDEALWRDIQQSAYLTIWDAQRRFSKGSSANNHLIGEAAGVFVGACYFRHFPNADSWARKAQAVLEREILLQTYDDGCTREHAFGYQFFVVQFFTLCLLAGDATGYRFSAEFRRRLHKAYRFLFEICADSGSPPDLCDRDDGYVLDLGDLPFAPGGLLDVGAEIFDDPKLRSANPSETVFWLTGHVRPRQKTTRTQSNSVSFPDPGYHLLRSRRLAVFFDCAELGYGPIAAHGHADCLSVCLTVDGQPVFVDAGTYDYFTHPQWRNYFRETRAHNTAEVDERSQSQMLGPFIWGRRARPRLLCWRDDDASTTVAGDHDGYKSLADPVIHARELKLDKNIESLLIHDKFEARGDHVVRLHFHVEPGIAVRSVCDGRIEIDLPECTLAVETSEDHINCIQADENTKLGWVSKRYHSKTASKCLRIEKQIFGQAEIHTRVFVV